MKYDFDTRVERRGTYCCKYDTIPEEAGENAIPVSIADMDLPCAEPIIRALHERIDQKISVIRFMRMRNANRPLWAGTGSVLAGRSTNMIYSSVRGSFRRWHF